MALLAFLCGTTNAQAQTFSVLYNFGSQNGDPLNPQYAGVIAQGRDGNLYSTTRSGGEGPGVVFKIAPTGALTVTYSFRPAGGGQPTSGLSLGTDGEFYGTTLLGGGVGKGKVFKVTQGGNITVLNGFKRVGGELPYAPPIQGTDGNFYGTASAGGNFGCQGQGCGTVYKITPSGKLTVLYVFDSTHGQTPFAPLVQGSDGSFYGTTSGGGTNGHGTVFKITTAGNLTVLYNFDGTHGAGPIAPLAQGNDGNFYGTAGGGANGVGVVFKLTPKGAITVLHQFNGTDGQLPYAGLVQATDGNFYGATASGGSIGGGTIFRVSGKGSFSTLYNFNNSDSTNPEVTLFEHTNGILYGDTFQGGTGKGCSTSGCGTFFSLDVGLKPFVSLVSTSGRIGKTIEILGQGFTGTTWVSFNGTAANFQEVSDTYLTATVPNGATTGYVTVTTPGGILTSNKKFRVKEVRRS